MVHLAFDMNRVAESRSILHERRQVISVYPIAIKRRQLRRRALTSAVSGQTLITLLFVQKL